MPRERTLARLLNRAGIQYLKAVPETPLSGITDDSRHVEPGNLFVATRGVRSDSHVFISDAIDRGATAIMVERQIPEYPDVAILQVEDTREVLGRLAHAWHDNPSRDMLVFGVSGTNGKTTTTYLLEAMLNAAGYSTGVIGTIEHRFSGEKVKAANTTPTAMQLAELFSNMKKKGVTAVAMEVSSHAADQRRISGIKFNVGILTNITQDHLDYHGTMENYAAAKKRFYFESLLEGVREKKPVGSVFNVDDPNGAQFFEEFPAEKIGFSLRGGGNIKISDVDITPTGISLNLNWQGQTLKINSPLLGLFNVYNVIGAASAGLLGGIASEAIVAGIAGLNTVPGRFEYVSEGQDFVVIVDYAHTPDALERVLTNARKLTNGNLITVFGCGGDRDPVKRPIMGEVAGRLSDYVILTNDNPRTENPQSIAEMAYKGISTSGMNAERAHVVLDRREAIGTAIALARPGDIVLIAGKGHEDYQILGQQVVHFDDREVAREFLQKRMNG